MERNYIEVPGSGTHELPPLLVRTTPDVEWDQDLLERAAEIVESEDMIAESAPATMDQRKLDLAVQLTDRYRGLLVHWAWGDSVIEWIRQCEITFEQTSALRNLLSADLWPHAARSSFVDLLLEKEVPTHGVLLDKAVGMRLTFRQPPPIDYFSNQFLLLLDGRLASAAYDAWARMSPDSSAHLPPGRFHFEVHDMSPS